MRFSRTPFVVQACGPLGSACLLFAGLLLICLPGAAAGEQSFASDALHALAAERPWQVLLHYRQQGERFESLVDDARFFLAENGKTDPEAELAADLQALLAPVARDDEHFRCLFPARSEWLVAALQLNELVLPQPVCGKLNETLATVAPSSVVLVFPAAHTNGPASMFGHTLLRIGSGYKSDLLSAAVNYAANDTDSNGLVYAYKGIFGYYPGYFSLLPYHVKLNEYSGVEHRDIWEYTLNLTPEEARRLMLHCWELQTIASDYYFFDENCSFMLFFLLEAARPELRLAESYWERSSFWVIPVDTIATVRRAGLITDVVYRPAQATRIRHRAGLLPDAAQRQALAIALQEQQPAAVTGAATSREAQRQILDLAAEYVQYRYSRRELTAEAFRPQFLAILKVRSQLGAGEAAADQVPEPEQPEAGHAAGRLSLGGGRSGARPYLEASWRPAYHDLLDPDAGFTRGAQINFFALSGRYLPQDEQLRLQSFRPVDIISLAPRDRFFQPVSWKVSAGIERLQLAAGTEPLVFVLNTGGGLAWETAAPALLYVMAEAELHLHHRYEENAELGAGLSAGALVQVTRRWKAHLAGRALGYAADGHDDYRVRLDQNFKLSRQTGITAHGAWQKLYGRTQRDIGLAFNWYF